jgi:hypothetical protein
LLPARLVHLFALLLRAGARLALLGAITEELSGIG